MRAQQKGAGHEPARGLPWIWPCWLLDLGLPVSKTKSNKFLLFISYTISSVPKCTETICKLKKIFFFCQTSRYKMVLIGILTWLFLIIDEMEAFYVFMSHLYFLMKNAYLYFLPIFSTRLPDVFCYLPVIYIFWIWIICQSHVQQINVLILVSLLS